MRRNVDELKVREAMTAQIYGVAPDTSLETVARLFSSRHITGAPVLDTAGRPVGVVTQTDLVDPDRDRSGHEGRSLFYRVAEGAVEPLGFDDFTAEGAVSDVMSPYVLTVSPEASLRTAARLMVMEDVHRLLVTEGDRLVGILTSMDVLRAFTA